MPIENVMPRLGAALPPFHLPAAGGGWASYEDFKDAKALVVMFLCGHCPYVLAVEDRLLALAREMESEEVAFVAISSNDFTRYPEDAPEALARRAAEKKYPFPYLIDEKQDVARAFDAACTPEFYVYNAERKLAYHGRLDDNWKNPEQVTRRELREAIVAILHNKPVAETQYPPMGCGIKWKNDENNA